ncbi:GNAT family N-acetyltransferase [Ruegeria halocynthiae]|uniref:GNAT family N-acetyltransferase n=1 Tax=Ruegeria halocynthiae TaxID=985054 RepID=UPI0005645FB4|nr:GNAT family N-acetyltransferase [Ruegeria halocynthiae]
MDDILIRPFLASDAPWLVQQHGKLYERDEGFDASFAVLVERILDAFIAAHDPTRERGWIAERAGERLGSIFCVTLDKDTAKLRLFLLVPEVRGQGLGRRMFATCLAFARGAGYKELALWTHESHKAACALYKAVGGQLMTSRKVHSFGVDLVEQSWKFRL